VKLSHLDFTCGRLGIVQAEVNHNYSHEHCSCDSTQRELSNEVVTVMYALSQFYSQICNCLNLFKRNVAYNYVRTILQLCLIALPLSLLFFAMPLPAKAQVVTWTQTDINSGSTGSFTYSAGSPPSYTIAGSGTGPGFIDSSLTFVGTPAFGACEIQGQIASQTNTGNGAIAGFCMRDSVQMSYSQEYIIGVTPANGIFFFKRYQTSGGSNVATAAGSAPVYLKMRRYGDQTNGYSVEGLYSSDGINWTSVGSFAEANTNPMPNKFYAGFVVSSTVNGATQSTAVFDHVSYLTSVPQQASNLLLRNLSITLRHFC